MRKSLITVILALAGFLLANAQYTFTISGGFSGNCANVSGYRELNQQLLQIKGQAVGGFPDRASCEQMRAVINSIKTQAIMIIYDARTGRVIDKKNYNCSFSLSASPCTGRPFGGSAGEPNILGVGQGSSFSSTNSTSEIQDWSSDDMERMLALNPEFVNYPLSDLSTGDIEADMARNNARETAFVIDPSKPFRSLNVGEDGQINTRSDDLSMSEGFNKVERANDFSQLANKENVQRYLEASTDLLVPYLANPQDLTQLLHKEFKVVSGYDVDAIMQKLPSERTDAEKQALNDYKQYRKEVVEKMADEIDVIIDKSKEKKEIDRAIIANDVYGTDKDNNLQYTNFEKVTYKDFEPSNPMSGVADAIKICNETGDDTGIHVELYYNENTNTYVISCAGSDDAEDWFYNNAANALGGDVPQYIMAKVIADAIQRIPERDKDKLNIEVVGHSLGGGMASIIGLATGINTSTYNAARVPENFLKENGLFEKARSGEIQNITAYHTSTDILTKTQQLAGTPALGVSIDMGDPSTWKERSLPSIAGAVTGGVAGVLMGPVGVSVGSSVGASVGKKFEGHRMGPIVREVYNRGMEEKNAEWSRFRFVQTSLHNEASSVEYQTQDAIQIFTSY